MAYVTGAAILAHARKDSPTAADTAWAETCAAAVEGAIAYRLGGLTYAEDSDAHAELVRAALQDGAAAYADRDAPHGIVSTGPDGQATRVGRDIVRALAPVLDRLGEPGIG